ncbi:MAG: STAS/SEC14 domain-containing protein [Formivibrio sp.]|nr:STAS/SEC14 domain-containing protein [Formivibrio sp.]
MISIVHETGYYHAVVFNEFTLQDFREFEQCVTYAAKFEGPVRMLVDLRDMSGYTLDAALEDVSFSKEHRQDIDRIAVLTSDQWVTWSAWLARMLTDAEIQVFEDKDDAVYWVLQADSEPIKAS